jgi:hypothetical protein
LGPKWQWQLSAAWAPSARCSKASEARERERERLGPFNINLNWALNTGYRFTMHAQYYSILSTQCIHHTQYSMFPPYSVLSTQCIHHTQYSEYSEHSASPHMRHTHKRQWLALLTTCSWSGQGMH